MELTELHSILIRGEGLRVEFKEAQNGVPATFYDTIVSFLNREGGVIILGVNDNGGVLGLGKQNLMNLKQDIVTALNNPEVVNPPYPLAVHEVIHSAGSLLYIRVPVSSVVHRHAGVFFDRENDSDIRVTDANLIARIYARKQQVFTENQIYPYLRMEDLDPRIFDKVRRLIASINSTHPWLQVDNERLLRDALFMKRDYSSGEEGLTLAAALVFGKDVTIGNILPAYRIDVMVRRENLDRWDDRLLLSTNLVDSYLQVLEFLKRHWPEKFFTEGGQRKDLRELIFRELTANVIVHREYNSTIATEIIIYDDRIESTNPNRARFTGPLDLNTFNAEPKNPNIRRFFNTISWADEIGSGVRNINKYLGFYAEGAKPSFIEGDRFLSVLPMQLVRVADRSVVYTGLAQLTDIQFDEGRLDSLRKLPISLDLKTIVDLDQLAITLVGRWVQKSRELDGVRLLKNKEIEIAQLKKVGSWAEKSGELLKKRSRVIISTLLLTLSPISLDELAEVLGYNSKERYRDDYVKPLKDNGLIEYTIPETPNDPNQAYVITQRGRDFLTGNEI